ncbi:hypothetical protein KHQ06_33070 [Nocardia tengchongensis]|uniref:Ig-like domain-containing protein n=1 Tax=Nocardia tengchongensis TaxID=2055889 RepID=A0ABX8CN93_9NOCA|nr:hypothetical protein [Nocardia tengchongensis]QVI20862.1 hypothetical protein KHQ06_33070 [Nocardia tengchongensis]
MSATVLGTAGSATADSGLTIQGSPMPVQVGSTYQVVDDWTVTSGTTTTGSSNPFTGPNSIWLYDNDRCVHYDMIGANGTGIKMMPWTPTTAGTHTLQVRAGSGAKTMTVTVEPAPPGTPIPAQTSCGANSPTGSFGS